MTSVHIWKSPILPTSPCPAVIKVSAKGTVLLWWGCWGWSCSCDTWADRAGVGISALHWKDKAHSFLKQLLESRVPKAGVPVPPVVTASVQTWHVTDGIQRAHSEDRFFYFVVTCGVKMNCLCFSSCWCQATRAKAKFSTGLVVTSLFFHFNEVTSSSVLVVAPFIRKISRRKKLIRLGTHTNLLLPLLQWNIFRKMLIFVCFLSGQSSLSKVEDCCPLCSKAAL